MLRLKEIMRMNNIHSNGIFTALSTFNPPWNYDNALLNIEYHFNYSGEKYISPLVERMLVNEELSEDNINMLASILNTLYMNKWKKLHDTLNLEYNPIDNYNLKETGEHNIDNTSNDTSTGQSSNSFTDTRTMNDSNESKVSAFNSNEYQDNSLSVVDNITQTTGSNTTEDSQNRNNTSNEQKNYTINKSGNIGVTTTQQMINAEREVNMWDFFKIIFSDIDEILTIKYYGGV